MKSILSTLPCIQVEHSQIMEDLTHPYVTDEPENIKKSITIHSDPYQATSGTHAIVLCTEWDEFKVGLAIFLPLLLVISSVSSSINFVFLFTDFRLPAYLWEHDETCICIWWEEDIRSWEITENWFHCTDYWEASEPPCTKSSVGK